MRTPLVVSAAIAVLALSGCSGGTATEAAGSPSPPASASASAGPTVEEFGSIISENRRDVDEWLEKWDEHTCSPLSVGDGDPLCEAHLVAGGYTAEAVKLSLQGATSTQSLVHIGDPPDEIKQLWLETEQAASAAADAGDEIPDDCAAASDCVGKVGDFVTAFEDVQSKFDSWDPYL